MMRCLDRRMRFRAGTGKLRLPLRRPAADLRVEQQVLAGRVEDHLVDVERRLRPGCILGEESAP